MRTAAALLILALPIFCIAQPHGPDLLWSRIWNDAMDEQAYSVLETGNETFVVAGTQTRTEPDPSDPYDSIGVFQGFLAELTSNGDTLWTHAYGGAGDQQYRCLCATRDGGYLLAGTDWTDSENLSGQLLLTRTDHNGNVIWSRSYGGHEHNEVADLAAAHDGHFLVCAESGIPDSGAIPLSVFEVDSVGNVIWTVRHSDLPEGILRGIAETADSGCVVVGTTGDRFYPRDADIRRYRYGGDTLWTFIYNAPLGICLFNDVVVLNDGSVVAAGVIEYWNPSMVSDVLVMKVAADGSLLWSYQYGGADWDDAKAMTITPDSGFALVGWSYSNGPGFNNGGYSDLYLLRTDRTGNLLWSQYQGNGGDDSGLGIALSHDGGFILAGYSNCNGFFGSGAYIAKTARDPALDARALPNSVSVFGLSCSPNPFNSDTRINFELSSVSNIQVSVFDLQGRLIERLTNGRFSSGRHTIRFDASALPSGVYFARLDAGSVSRTVKLMLLR